MKRIDWPTLRFVCFNFLCLHTQQVYYNLTTSSSFQGSYSLLLQYCSLVVQHVSHVMDTLSLAACTYTNEVMDIIEYDLIGGLLHQLVTFFFVMISVLNWSIAMLCRLLLCWFCIAQTISTEFFLLRSDCVRNFFQYWNGWTTSTNCRLLELTNLMKLRDLVWI